MLRASSETHEEEVNLGAIMDGSATGGIEFGDELAAFSEAVVAAVVAAADADLEKAASTLALARDQLVEVAGFDVMVDAAGVASNFQRMTRIADSTGITLGGMEEMTVGLRETLGIEEFKT